MTAAIVLRYTAAFCVMAWAIAATIFITPSWICSLVMALELLELACFTLAAKQSVATRFGQTLANTLQACTSTDDLLNIVDEAREAARSEQARLLQDITTAKRYQGNEYPQASAWMVDSSGKPLVGGDVVSALASHTDGNP